MSAEEKITSLNPPKNHIISWRKIRLFLEDHRDHGSAPETFKRWYDTIRHARFENFADVRRLFASADQVGHWVVFNVGGNKYRVIAEINYRSSTIFLRHVLTHAEYDEGKWRP